MDAVHFRSTFPEATDFDIACRTHPMVYTFILTAFIGAQHISAFTLGHSPRAKCGVRPALRSPSTRTAFSPSPAWAVARSHPAGRSCPWWRHGRSDIISLHNAVAIGRRRHVLKMWWRFSKPVKRQISHWSFPKMSVWPWEMFYVVRPPQHSVYTRKRTSISPNTQAVLIAQIHQVNSAQFTFWVCFSVKQPKSKADSSLPGTCCCVHIHCPLCFVDTCMGC